jgi:hypothetical protein
MKRGDEASEKAGEALEYARQAAGMWNASDRDCVDRTRQTLESAARKAVELESLLRGEQSEIPPNLRPRVLALKAEVRRIERLVDASAAFFRTAFPVIGTESPVYNSGGALTVESRLSGSPGLQG